MIILFGLDSKNYWQKLGSGHLPELRCPSCPDTRLGPHGWYRRFLNGKLVAFRRTLCDDCGATHALLPEDVCAYEDLTLPDVERAVDAGSPTPAARAVGEVTDASVRRARRWLRRSVWPMLRGAPDHLVDRIVTLAGESPGWLLRARRRLWSELGVLLGGPCGLFVCGWPWLQLSELSNIGRQLFIGSEPWHR